MPNAPRIIPGWLVKTVCAALGLAFAGGIPWATSVTNSLSVMAVRLEHTQQALDGLPALEQRFGDHTADPGIHHAGILRLQSTVDSLERRLESLERKKEQ